MCISALYMTFENESLSYRVVLSCVAIYLVVYIATPTESEHVPTESEPDIRLVPSDIVDDLDMAAVTQLMT